MRFFARRTLILAAFALFIAAFAPRAPVTVAVVHAAQTWTVQAGADIPGGNFAALAYYPASISVNVGDTVSWTFPGANDVHTVTFDNGHSPSVYLIGISTPGPNPGDLDATAILVPYNFTPPSSAFDPTAQISIPIATDPPDQRTPQSLVFSTPGVYSYICAVHGPEMSGTVTVQAATAALSESPAQAAARGQAAIGAATGAVTGALQENLVNPGSSSLPDGTTVHNVAVGAAVGNQVVGLQFFPGSLSVKRGDVVVFTMSDARMLHTVTFASGGPDPDFIVPLPQAAGPPKFIMPASTVLPQGGNIYTGRGLLHSGFLVQTSTFIATIDAPPGTYEYHCLVHGGFMTGMSATITVQ